MRDITILRLEGKTLSAPGGTSAAGRSARAVAVPSIARISRETNNGAGEGT